jgi:hypothetical protein
VAKPKTHEAITITVRLPRHVWPEEFVLPEHPSSAALSLVGAQLTGRETIMVIRIEGSLHEIQEALLYWEGCGFTVEKDAPSGRQDSRGEPGNRTESSLSRFVGAHSSSSHGFLSSAATPTL